jgi:hypothetical protein
VKGKAWSPKARSTPAGTFRADSVLAKHDETYMPKDVAEALKNRAIGRTITRRSSARWAARHGAMTRAA